MVLEHSFRKNISCNYPGRRKRQKIKNRIKISSPIEKPIIEQAPAAVIEKKHGDIFQLFFHCANSSFIAERFLDPDVFSRAQLTVVNADVAVTDEIARLVGSILDIQATSERFFKSIHIWMPIISKPQFSATLLNRLTYKRAELFLLVLSMKLCSTRVKTWNTPLYETVKLFHFKIEASGVLSILVLQASILIALYELGHSIYPAAFLSIGSCARYATALGVDKSILSSNTTQFQWIEEEESRRAWWAILVLDRYEALHPKIICFLESSSLFVRKYANPIARYLNLCDPKRHLITQDADLGSYLPVDDEAWNQGVSDLRILSNVILSNVSLIKSRQVPDPEYTYTLATANSYHLGLFARFAQASHLLSRVLRHISEQQPNETSQLRRTIFALVNVSKIEASMRRLEYCSQTAVCYR